MEDREKLIQILSVPIHPRIGADPAEVVADYLLDNGVRPERHAYWVYNPNANDWGLGGWCCSKCHFKNDALGIVEKLRFPISMIAGTKYCANCGARMLKEVQL